VKGSDLALETMVENSGEETTYWSLKKSMEKPYYDQEIDKDPNDPGSGITAKLMSEVAVTKGLAIEGAGADSLKKRTLDVNSFDIQVANDTGVEGGSAEDITLKNAWLTIADYSNTTGAELAIGNNARFVIDQGGKLIIDQTCQLEIEWDGATTAPGTGTQPDILNNGQLDLRAGGEIVNNGIITIEGTEGKPLQPETAQQANESVKGRGEMTIRKGATLTNNGALVVYGALTNYGRLVNNGRYNDVIKSNDPDKGAFNYHKGIQVSWKDDVTQMNIEAGSLTNQAGAVLINNGDIVLMPGILENKGLLLNQRGAHIYAAAATEAIIPITPDPATPTIVTKRITLDPVKLSYIINSGTLINYGVIAPATVALLDNTGGFDKLTSPGDHPELFSFINTGILHNYGYIYGMVSGNTAGKTYTGTDGTPVKGLVAALAGSFLTDNDLWLYLYEDGTFLMILPNGEKLYGTYEFKDDLLVFTFADGTVEEPELDENGNSVYRITTESGFSIEFVLPADFITEVRTTLEKLKA
jgi:adhesin HecA-like repeat protein